MKKAGRLIFFSIPVILLLIISSIAYRYRWTISFKPGAPTATPPGAEITDPDFVAGVQAYEKGDILAVGYYMLDVVGRSPELAHPHWYLGRYYYKTRQYDLALEQYGQALAINSNYALAYADRGLTYITIGETDKGLKDYKTALFLDPSLARVHHNLGIYYSGIGDTEQAFAEYNKALGIDPTRVLTWIAWANDSVGTNRFSECIEHTTVMLEQDPPITEALIARSICYEYMGDYDESFNDAQSLVQQIPDDAEGWYRLGITQNNLNQYFDSADSYSQVIALDPLNYRAYINRGAAYLQLYRIPEALADYDKALEFGDIAEAYFGKGWAHLQNGEPEKALAAFEKYLQLVPSKSNDLELLRGMASANDRSGNTKKAFELYTNLINTYQYAETYFFRARIFEDREMLPEAIHDYETFLQLVRANPTSYLEMLALDAEKRINDLQTR